MCLINCAIVHFSRITMTFIYKPDDCITTDSDIIRIDSFCESLPLFLFLIMQFHSLFLDIIYVYILYTRTHSMLPSLSPAQGHSYISPAIPSQKLHVTPPKSSPLHHKPRMRFYHSPVITLRSRISFFPPSFTSNCHGINTHLTLTHAEFKPFYKSA